MELFDDVIVGEFHLCRYMNSLAAALCRHNDYRVPHSIYASTVRYEFDYASDVVVQFNVYAFAGVGISKNGSLCHRQCI